jgi:hypothetical protein
MLLMGKSTISMAISSIFSSDSAGTSTWILRPQRLDGSSHRDSGMYRVLDDRPGMSPMGTPFGDATDTHGGFTLW